MCGPGYDATAVERVPEVTFDLLLRRLFTHRLLHGKHKSRRLLVCETKKRYSAVATSHVVSSYPCNGPARPRSAAEYDKYGSDSAEPTRSAIREYSSLRNTCLRTSGMSGHVSAFVVAMQGDVETHILGQALIRTNTQQLCVVSYTREASRIIQSERLD